MSRRTCPLPHSQVALKKKPDLDISEIAMTISSLFLAAKLEFVIYSRRGQKGESKELENWS